MGSASEGERLYIEPHGLREYATVYYRLRHPRDGEHVGRQPHGDLLGFSVVEHVVEALDHDLLELLVDVLLRPEEVLNVLHPLEVGYRHAAGIGDDVGHQHDTAPIEDAVRLRGSRAVRALDDEPGFHSVGVVPGDLVLDGGGYENVARQLQQFVASDLVNVPHPLQAAVLVLVAYGAVNVNAVGLVDSAHGVAHSNDAAAHIAEY